MALPPEEVGARIRRARIAKGWTHEQFAREASVGLRTVQRWQKGRDPVSGRSWLPRLSKLVALSELFDVPKGYFIEDAEEIDSSDPALRAQLEDAARQLVEAAVRLEAATLRLESYLNDRERREAAG